MKLFIVSICYTNKDKGIFLSFYFFWSNIMTYIKCFLWQYFICHQIWTCPITIVLVIFLTTQNMTMLLLTTRWPIMIHQSNLRLNNPKEMNFCLCVFDPVIRSLCTMPLHYSHIPRMLHEIFVPSNLTTSSIHETVSNICIESF